MNNTDTVIKVILASIAVLVLSTAMFLAGCGSAYLLRKPGPGILVWPSASGPSGPRASTSAAPTATPVPIPTPERQAKETFQLFWTAWNLVQKHFYGELPDMQEVTYGAIQGMLDTLDDDYTAFIKPDVADILDEDASGEFEGIGAFVDVDESGKLWIVDTFDDGPAEKAGLQAGDRVVAVDGESIVGDTLYHAIGKIRGPAGSEVTLLIEREGDEPFTVAITRAHLEIPIVDAKLQDGDIGYIRLREFSATASKRMEKELSDLLSREPRGIVLDLRQNPGGWLDQAIEVADLFLEKDLIASERFSSGDEQKFKASPGDVAEEVPLVVLVNNGTASASEIVAGALQDRGRAILIGTPTFGKGSVQRPFDLDDGSELRVTVALWFTPKGQPIEDQGLTPDIEVPWPKEDRRNKPESDPQLERAIEYLATGK